LCVVLTTDRILCPWAMWVSPFPLKQVLNKY
jgi:hypothetical protein